jgi:23S rRNA pseudouridine1911/1915/1917 synthase
MDAGVSTRHAIIPDEAAGWRLDRTLATLVPTLSRERLKTLISAGSVTRGDAAVRDPATKVKAGDRSAADA